MHPADRVLMKRLLAKIHEEAGTRVEQVASGGSMPINLNVGIGSAALGMP